MTGWKAHLWHNWKPKEARRGEDSSWPQRKHEHLKEVLTIRYTNVFILRQGECHTYQNFPVLLSRRNQCYRYTKTIMSDNSYTGTGLQFSSSEEYFQVTAMLQLFLWLFLGPVLKVSALLFSWLPWHCKTHSGTLLWWKGNYSNNTWKV